jgi:sulfur carrier protein
MLLRPLNAHGGIIKPARPQRGSAAMRYARPTLLKPSAGLSPGAGDRLTAARPRLATARTPRHLRPIMATTTAPTAAAKTISITVNGEAQELPAPITVAGLLARIGLDTRKVAVERNLEIVPRSTYAGTALAAGDALEIVHFIGGG